MVLFRGVCEALRAMHKYRVNGKPGGKRSARNARRVRAEAAAADRDAVEEVEEGRGEGGKGKGRRRRDEQQEEQQEDGEVEAEPLMEGEVTMAQDGVADGEIRAYAHRDIKPGMSPTATIEYSLRRNTYKTSFFPPTAYS